MTRHKVSFVAITVVAIVVVLYLVRHVARLESPHVPLTSSSPRLRSQGSGKSGAPQEVEGILLPEHAVIDNLTYEEAASLYHRYVDNIQYFCPLMDRMGKANDGGWEICISSLYRPKPPCLVYSFGINNDFTFDDDARGKLGCEIHCFDPSMNQKDHIRKQGIFFHDLGLANYSGSSDKGWTMLTLQAIREWLGHTKRRIDILKMDIEGMEWDAIPEMLQSGALQDVDQFVMEVHVMPVGLRVPVDPAHERYTKGLHVLKQLYDHGFRLFFSHRNPGCTYMSRFGPERIGCNEIFTVRLK